MATVFFFSDEIDEAGPKQRVNYANETEGGVNKQINLELYAHYTYMSMVRFFLSIPFVSGIFFFTAGFLNS